MTRENAHQRFKKAVGMLVDEKGPIKERLLIAYASQLSEVDQNHDLPNTLVSEFDRVKYALSDAEMPYGYGEHAAKKIDDMTDEEASEMARTIFALFLKLHELEAQEASG